MTDIERIILQECYADSEDYKFSRIILESEDISIDHWHPGDPVSAKELVDIVKGLLTKDQWERKSDIKYAALIKNKDGTYTIHLTNTFVSPKFPWRGVK